MEKRMSIEGMMCARCAARVEKALSAMDGVSAKVDLSGASVSLSKDVPDSALIEAVEKAGYKVKEIV